MPAVQFGVFLEPTADDLYSLLAQVRTAEEQGLDLIGIQDHPYQRRFLDTWTLIAFLAGRTERIGFFPDVANLPLRPPAMLGKAVASLDRLSGGRVELGLGAGAFWEAIGAMGGPVRTPGESVAALAEAIEVIRLMWSGQATVSFSGRQYSLTGLHPGPPPAHPVGIWLGAYQPRMLRLTGRMADGWIPSLPRLPLAELPERIAIIEAAARSAGREPASIRRIANVSGRIGGPDEGFLRGPLERWVADLTSLVRDHGFEAFVLWADGDPLAQIRVFGSELAPAVRAALEGAGSG